MLSVETDDAARTELLAGLDELVREGARRMLATALEAEVDAYVDAYAEQVDEHGHRLAVRNGRARPRAITTAAGAITIAAPRVHDQRVDPESGERQRFRRGWRWPSISSRRRNNTGGRSRAPTSSRLCAPARDQRDAPIHNS